MLDTLKMGHGRYRGFEYRIVIKKNFDYFDVVPSLESRIRRRVEWRSNSVIITSIEHTRSRTLTHLRKNGYSVEDWMKLHDWSYETKTGGTLLGPVCPIALYDHEKMLISEYLKIIRSMVDHHGWYDYCYEY